MSQIKEFKTFIFGKVPDECPIATPEGREKLSFQRYSTGQPRLQIIAGQVNEDFLVTKCSGAGCEAKNNCSLYKQWQNKIEDKPKTKEI